MKLEIFKTTQYTVIEHKVISLSRYDLIGDNRYIAHCTAQDQNSYDSIATGKLMKFFEDHINEMFDLSNRPIYNTGGYFPKYEKLCEMSYTDYELKKLRVKKKIEKANKDFE